jgi:hypothetical protein
LDELAEALAEENDNTKETQLKQIRNWEKVTEGYKAVKLALNTVNDQKKGGGLTHLQVTENRGTRTITDPGPMAETLRDFAVKHYGQTNHTIFGYGKEHDILTEDPMTNPVYDTFLDGTFIDTDHIPNRTEGSNLFIKHIKSKLPEGVEKELTKMAEPMLLKEWRRFYLTARDKTTTSMISGLHRGIYKACACDDTLVSMQTVILSLAFEFGLKGISRWHNAVDYILKKGKCTVLGKLRTIKLLECDHNFGLKCVFVWRLGAFVEKHEIYKKARHALPG